MAEVDSKNFKIPQKETDNAKEANTNEEPKKKGMMDKIKASKPYQMYERFKTWKTYHFIQALLSYIALITLLASLGLLNNPPEFPYPTQESDIKSATEHLSRHFAKYPHIWIP